MRIAVEESRFALFTVAIDVDSYDGWRYAEYCKSAAEKADDPDERAFFERLAGAMREGESAPAAYGT